MNDKKRTRPLNEVSLMCRNNGKNTMVVIFIFVQNLVMISIAQNVWQHNRFVDNVKGEPSEKQMLDIYIINLCCILIKKEKFNQKILEKLMFASIVWLNLLP